MEKIDFKKQLPLLYAPKNTEWHEVTVPSMLFLKIDGAGDPNVSPDYKAAVEALYSLSYTLKFMSKKELSKDYVVSLLEGLWYADDLSVFESGDKSSYEWTMMIMQPDWITADMVERARALVALEYPEHPYDHVRFEAYQEGASLQLLHVGSYDQEAPKLYALHHEIMPQNKLQFNGHHHEIYISDPRKIPSEKLKTILRQPIKSAI